MCCSLTKVKKRAETIKSWCWQPCKGETRRVQNDKIRIKPRWIFKITILLLVENIFFSNQKFVSSFSLHWMVQHDNTGVFITEAFSLFLHHLGGASARWSRPKFPRRCRPSICAPASRQTLFTILGRVWPTSQNVVHPTQHVQSAQGRRCPRGAGQRWSR